MARHPIGTLIRNGHVPAVAAASDRDGVDWGHPQMAAAPVCRYRCDDDESCSSSETGERAMIFDVAGQPARLIYRCIIGSRTYGLATQDSDLDRLGIYLPSAELHWSLEGAPAQLEDAERQECYWELEKFLRLALAANPTILECLYTPLIELETDLAAELRRERSRFLSARLFPEIDNHRYAET